MILRFSGACQHAFTKVIESEIMLRIPFVRRLKIKDTEETFSHKAAQRARSPNQSEEFENFT